MEKEISGRWAVKGDCRVFTFQNYQIEFVKLPEKKDSFYDIYQINVYKDEKEVMNLALRKSVGYNGPTYSMIHLTPEGDAILLRNYGAVEQEQDVIAVHSINTYSSFEKNVLNGISFEEYVKIRKKIVDNTKKAFEDSRYFDVLRFMNGFVLFKFEPKQNKHNYWLNVAYDYKNDKFSLLNTQKSLEYFLKRNRVELNNGKNEKLITEKNKENIVDLIKNTSTNQFKRVVYEFEDVFKINYVTEDNKPEIEKRIAPIKKILKPPTIKGNKLTLYLLTTWFPSELEEWIIVEKGFEFEINTKTILKQVYVPGFLTDKFTASEENVGYIG